jgi:hypothetical protein
LPEFFIGHGFKIRSRSAARVEPDGDIRSFAGELAGDFPEQLKDTAYLGYSSQRCIEGAGLFRSCV